MTMTHVLGAVFAVTLAACTATSDDVEVAEAEETGAAEGARAVSDVAAVPTYFDHESRFTRARPGGMCGGIAGIRCAAGLYCDFAPEARMNSRSTVACGGRSEWREMRTLRPCASSLAYQESCARMSPEGIDATPGTA